MVPVQASWSRNGLVSKKKFGHQPVAVAALPLLNGTLFILKKTHLGQTDGWEINQAHPVFGVEDNLTQPFWDARHRLDMYIRNLQEGAEFSGFFYSQRLGPIPLANFAPCFADPVDLLAQTHQATLVLGRQAPGILRRDGAHGRPFGQPGAVKNLVALREEVADIMPRHGRQLAKLYAVRWPDVGMGFS